MLTREAAEAHIAAKAYGELLQHDQLHAEMAAGRVFSGFSEGGPVTHPPTFKYEHGTLDTLDASKKQRVPSFTDRVLFRGG